MATTTTQEKVKRLLAQAATDLCCELVVDAAYANVGTYYVESPNALRVLWSRPYDFQPGYASFAEATDKSKSSRPLHYVTRDRLEAAVHIMIDEIRDAVCGERGTPQARDPRLEPECPDDCTNYDMGTCPRCYEEYGQGCPHGELCENCQDDLQPEEKK